MTFYITGDTHSNFLRIKDFCRIYKPDPDDIMVILGDVGLNFYGGHQDDKRKRSVSKLPLTLFCIHGNHEMRPTEMPGYEETTFCGGTVWYEPCFPNLLFAKDGEVYDFGGKKCLVIGGAYSPDKPYRVANGLPWFDTEQPTAEIRARVEARIAAMRGEIDYVFSHTCPKKYEPVECFLPQVDQSKVDKSTERWLDTIESGLKYERWYCGHWHIEKTIDRMRFMFKDIIVLPTNEDGTED